MSSIMVAGCSGDNDATTTVDDSLNLPTVEEPAPISVQGSSLYCSDTIASDPGSTLAASLTVEAPDSIAKHNVSFDVPGESWNNHNAVNRLGRLNAAVAAQKPNGDPVLDDSGAAFDVHPLLVSYGEQVIGEFEGGDGSADVPDPDNIDDIFVSMSLDNGTSWKKYKVGDTAKSTSAIVTWDGVRIPYPGHSHKPTMAVYGNNILVAWNDKYCPSGNPFDLEDPTTEDYYKVNGSQGTVDYGGVVFEPNGKIIYEAPYSCVWTARGVFSTEDLDADGDLDIEWRQAQQLTSGTRDSNKIWIAAETIGFALTWQEDPDGLRPGKGLGPGAGWSGATTNHGADIWYTYITMDDFDDVCTEFDADGVCISQTDDPLVISGLAEKPKPAVNYAYPVRISNNEICSAEDTKLYCADQCIATVSVESQSGQTNLRCVQSDLDYMVPDATIAPAAAILDGDTGASRPALKILKTNAAEPEYISILVYEETKGLSESSPADQDQGDSETDIELEGKAVYFESFFWDQPVEVSAGRIVNTFVPIVETVDTVTGEVTLSGIEAYENARRVVIMGQVDACEMQDGDPTFALIYKQGYDTQGGPSDMFVRVNYGFTYDDFGLLDNREVTNVSAQDNDVLENSRITEIIWDETYMDLQSYDNALDNTFSPRGWLRGSDVYTGFEYSPLWRATSLGTIPNNFYIHRFVDGQWFGPVQLSMVTGAQVSTLDPRYIPTPVYTGTTPLASDASNPDVLFLAYGTFDMETGEELDLFYTRSTDQGATWEYISNGELVAIDAGPDRLLGTEDDSPSQAERLAKLASRADVHEMEVQGLASPDGTMFMGAWLEETAGPVTEAESQLMGLESRFGLVEYDTDVVAP